MGRKVGALSWVFPATGESKETLREAISEKGMNHRETKKLKTKEQRVAEV